MKSKTLLLDKLDCEPAIRTSNLSEEEVSAPTNGPQSPVLAPVLRKPLRKCVSKSAPCQQRNGVIEAAHLRS
jgi:hypothetical protein